MCHLKLRAPNGTLFFSNLPYEKNGPGGELRIGVNLGVDWYMYYPLWFQLIKFCCRFSYIHSNIASSHSSCPTSFSICNLPPGYRYVALSISACLAVKFSRYHTSNLMCTSILPCPKEQNPDEIQCFLWPIVSNLLRLWKDGITCPTESMPQCEFVLSMLWIMYWLKQATSFVSSSWLSYVTNLSLIKLVGLHPTPTPTSAHSAGYQRMRRTNQPLFGQEVSHACLISLSSLTLYSILP